MIMTTSFGEMTMIKLIFFLSLPFQGTLDFNAADKDLIVHPRHAVVNGCPVDSDIENFTNLECA